MEIKIVSIELLFNLLVGPPHPPPRRTTHTHFLPSRSETVAEEKREGVQLRRDMECRVTNVALWVLGHFHQWLMS
jgi:hypothetical protein